MPVIEVHILGESHKIACGEGQENNLLKLVEKLNSRLKKVASTSSSASLLKLLILNSLIMEDELESLAHSKDSFLSKDYNSEITMSKTLDAVTDYVEDLTKKIEKL